MASAAIEVLRGEIFDASGSEILAVGRVGEDGVVSEVVVAARGHETAVPVVEAYAEYGDVLIHNHPSGDLRPSGPDLDVAARYAEAGYGFFIIDNLVELVYVVVEPVIRRDARLLDIPQLEEILLPGGCFSKLSPSYEL